MAHSLTLLPTRKLRLPHDAAAVTSWWQPAKAEQQAKELGKNCVSSNLPHAAATDRPRETSGMEQLSRQCLG